MDQRAPLVVLLRRGMFPRVAMFALCAVLLLGIADLSYATTKPENVRQEAGIDEHLDQFVDLNLRFRDSAGQERTLRELVPEKRPVIITPVYYTCPRLCGLTLDGVVKLINGLDLKLGSDYRVISVSFDPEDTPKSSMERLERARAALTDKGSLDSGWSFLSGTADNVSALMEQLGFRYKPDEGEFIHASSIIILTPQGKISRYFYGIEFVPKDVRFSLVEASKGKIGSTLDKLLLFCFRYDAHQGRYTFAVMRAIQIFSFVLLGVLATVLFRLRRSEKLNATSHTMRTRDGTVA